MLDLKTDWAPTPTASRPMDWPTRLTWWAFVLALVVVVARATVLETLRDPFEPTPGMAGAPRGTGPDMSLLLDLLCCAPALLVLGRRAIDRTYTVRWSWSHLPMLGLVIWCGLSVTWASDQFAAMIGAANFISALALLWSATQLVRSWGRLRLVAATLFGILLLYLAAGFEYRLVDLPELRQQFQERRTEILRERGLEEGSFAAKQFENKAMGGDVGCFSNSPNTYAAALVLLGLIAGGIAVQRIANRDPIGWALAAGAALPLAALLLYYTHSRTGMATCALGIALLLALRFLRSRLDKRRRLLYWVAVGGLALGAAAVIGHGLAHNSLGEKSLTFRWYYWTGAARLFAHHPFTGVGWSNFGPQYLQVRGPLATEEVQDPHNFIVKAFTELGVFGGVLMLAWVMRLWWELTRPTLPSPVARTVSPPGRRGILILAGFAAWAMCFGLIISTDFSAGYPWVILQAFRRITGTLLLLAGLAIAGLGSLREEKVDENPAPWVLYAMIVGAGVFFLHNMVDFAMSEPSALFILALVVGSAAGMRHPSKIGPKSNHRGLAIAAFAVGSLAWIAAAVALWAMTLLAERAAADGDHAIMAPAANPEHRQRLVAEAVERYSEARSYQPLNADYSYRAARALMQSNFPPLMVLGTLEQAIQSNPCAVKYYRAKAGYLLLQEHYDKAEITSAFDRALSLDPRNVDLRISYADALAKMGDEASAAAQYRSALQQDDQLPLNEPKRLPPQKRREIEIRLQAALSPN